MDQTNMNLLCIALHLPILMCCLSSGIGIDNGLVEVWKALGWNRLVLVGEHLGHDEAMVLKSASQQDIQASFIFAEKYYQVIKEEDGSLFVQSYYIFVGAALLEEIKHCLLQLRRPYSIMVVTDENHQKNHIDFDSFIRALDEPLGFFNVMLSKLTDEARLFRIQTLIGGGNYVKDEWRILPSGFYEVSYNMQGHTVTSSTLTWRPWFVMDQDCQETETPCRHSGVLSEMMDVMGKMYNFTWSATPEPDGNWGVSPLNREDGLQTHDYVGVLGNIVNRKYDISISIWAFFHERTAFLDYTTAVTTTPRILMIDGSNV